MTVAASPASSTPPATTVDSVTPRPLNSSARSGSSPGLQATNSDRPSTRQRIPVCCLERQNRRETENPANVRLIVGVTVAFGGAVTNNAIPVATKVGPASRSINPVRAVSI